MSHLCSRTSLWLPHCCGATCGSLFALQRLRRFWTREGRSVFFGFVLFCRRVDSKISRTFLWSCVLCVFGWEPWDCCLTILYIKKCTHSQHRALESTPAAVASRCLCSLFYFMFSERIEAAGWRFRGAGGGSSTLPHIRSNHEFSTMPNVLCAVVQLLISLVFPPPLPSSLCTFSSLYLFKAEIYGLYQAWEGEANVAVDGNHRLFYFTAVYLFTLEICFVSFLFSSVLFDFLTNKVIFHS